MRLIFWCARRLVLTLIPPFMVAGIVLGQSIPRLGGEFEKLWTVESGPSWLEGPAYDGAAGIWFTNLKDLSPNTPTDILRHDIATGTTDVMVDNSGGANGLAFDHEGRLLAALWHDGSLTRRPVNDLTNVTVLADNLVAPNDLSVADDGGIFFTDQKGAGVYYLNPAGDLMLAAAQEGANGIALSPTGGTLYVVAERVKSILSFNLSANGTLTDRRVFVAPDRFLDGLTVDRFGNLYAPTAVSVSTGHEVRVWSSAGDQVLAFEPPELAINATFALGDMLYLTTLTSLYRVPITFTFPGDYNGDGGVDAADYVVWRNDDGTQAGYDKWRANFGAMFGSGSSSGATVPEPNVMTLVLWTLSAVGSLAARAVAYGQGCSIALP